MSKAIQSIRGMHDVLPDQTGAWQWLEETARGLFSTYGYREIRMPIVEHTELFERSIGKVTDIVEKEMYTFDDRNGDSLTLRPEGTAGCVRAGIQNGLLHNQQQRLWYAGPMFRHERPQKGRYRQFHQIGVETFGFEGPDIDAELILMTARLWSRLGIGSVRLEINSLGTADARASYRERLVEWFMRHEHELDDDSCRRLHTNPMRILDSKNPAMRPIVEGAPSLLDHLDEESRHHFDRLQEILGGAGIDFTVNPRLVRGLDYYGRTVFEWITDALGAQGTVCAGGRYDGLVAQLGGQTTPAAGFAMGVERLLALVEADGSSPPGDEPDAWLVVPSPSVQGAALLLAEELRESLPQLKLTTHCGSGGLKAQMRRADRSGARIALIFGDEEAARGVVDVKDLRGGGQETVAREELPAYLAGTIGEDGQGRPLP